MKLEELKNKMIAVAGYGHEGKAVANYLIKHGLNPVLFDQKDWAAWPEAQQQEIRARKINFVFGPDAFLELKGFDFVFRSPGIKLVDLKDKVSKHTIITSQSKWFFDNCPAKIVGVTGTKGKGTTSSLIYEMLKHQSTNTNKQTVYLTGNIGKTAPLEILDELKEQDIVVFEMSSFQLEDLEVSPHVSVVLMVTSEHLDYHKNIDDYHSAKSAITKFQTENDFAVINKDFSGSLKIGELSKGRKYYFSRKVDDADAIVLGSEVQNKLTNFKFEVSKLKLRGEHNYENVLAAMIAAQILGVSNETVENVLANFKGLEHRLEFVSEKNGIKFYNDSFSTTPETAIAAIKSFAEGLIVILGGSSKKSDFTELGKAIIQAENLKAVILVGEESQNIKKAITGFDGLIFEGAKNLDEFFDQALKVALPGDSILLSPACASFDMFKNYQDRGEKFKNKVKELHG